MPNKAIDPRDRVTDVIEKVTGVRLKSSETVGLLKVYGIQYGFVGSGRGRRVVVDASNAEALGAVLGKNASLDRPTLTIERRVGNLEEMFLEYVSIFDRFMPQEKPRVISVIEKGLAAQAKPERPRVLVVGPKPAQGQRIIAEFEGRCDVTVMKPEPRHGGIRKQLPRAELCVIMADFLDRPSIGVLKAAGYPSVHTVHGAVSAVSGVIDQWISSYPAWLSAAAATASEAQRKLVVASAS